MFGTIDHASVTGPTRDMAAITAKEPVWSEERFQMRPKRLPVQLALKTRPKVSATRITSLQPGRVPILIRSSNQRPSEAGTGTEGGVWGVSDPGVYHRPDSGVSGITWDTKNIATVALLGISAGLVAWMLLKRK